VYKRLAPAPEARVSKFVPLGDEPPKPPAPKPDPAAAPTVRRLDPSERTTQQPLPPRPPLDMLADLTNNPPPPPSPMRTVVRRVKIYAPIVVLLAVILAVVQLVRPLPAPKLVLTAKSQYTFPGGAPELPWPTEGQASMAAAGLGTIGSSGEQKPVPIASVTKSMTAYIIMRDHPFKKGEKGALIDVDKTAETEGQKDKSDNESTLNTVKEGDKISEYDAIAALMIPSANNIARLLARWDSGSQEAFVKKMNDTAKQLGMTNTTYTDPSGLDATTVSTAEDQVKLGLKIVELDALVDITRKPSWTDQTGKNWPNWNRLVPYNESLGIKTGTTTKAGGNLLFAAYKKVGDTNQLIVGAVLGQHKPPIIDTVIAASKNLLVATQKSLEGAPVVKKGDVVGYVDDGVGGRTKVVATADVQAVGWSSLTVDIKLGDGGTKIPGTAKAGTAVGVLTVGDGASQVKVPVALQSELVAPGIGSKLTRIG
ncbi:D-alanyl-D-alanine carboxypeptidase family protein, partial [Streptomyces sp. NPDC127112]|uniref:D-alanyl-D-alanine carboxypeptidase family protein n=1 Tax=Streptomyces sp. NPDC127112 TaxID=3345364 RepID=UPI00362D88AB